MAKIKQHSHKIIDTIILVTVTILFAVAANIYIFKKEARAMEAREKSLDDFMQECVDKYAFLASAIREMTDEEFSSWKRATEIHADRTIPAFPLYVIALQGQFGKSEKDREVSNMICFDADQRVKSY